MPFSSQLATLLAGFQPSLVDLGCLEAVVLETQALSTTLEFLNGFQSHPAMTAEIGETSMPTRISTSRNEYRCSIERNQSGKYCVRLRVYYPRHAWTLNVYFLASTFDRAMKRLEEALDFLQRQEDKLWFWGVERAEDMGFSAEFLKQAGMRLDRRNEFPKRATSVTLAPEREVPASVLGPMRRGLAESVEFVRAAAAGD